MRGSAPWLCLGFAITIAGCQCKKEAPKTVLLDEGQECQSDDQCKTGLCDGVPVIEKATCHRKCASGCADGEVCAQLTENRFACVPDARRLCQACMVDTDCPYPSDKCLVVNGENVCGRDCAFDQNCPEGYRCVNGKGTDGNSKPQQCSPINASCACLARGDFLQPCTVTNAFGTCMGIKQCDLVANMVACDAPTPEADVCNNKDDNCDGHIDEDAGTISCGVGACLRTATACVNGAAGSCTPGDAGVELCDGIDNNCDGVVDDGFPVESDVNNCGACLKVCSLPHATPFCEMRTCKVQSCDTGYDNCNTMDPDGCEVNLKTDPMHCGSCTNACSSQNSVASCVNGACQFVCAAGFIDLDQDPSNGCEYACTVTSMTDLPDAPGFVDANCDGIDGELNNGIFVSPNGLDSNAGTRAAPKLTIAAAVTALGTTGKRDVYVAAGTYNEPLEVLGLSGVNVAGQYHPTSWQRHLTANTTTVATGNPALKIEAATNVLVQGFKLEGGAGNAASPTAYGGFVSESTGVKLERLDITAGRGADGAPGAGGTMGTPGSPGLNGAPGCINETRGGFGSNEQTACFGWFELVRDTYCNSTPNGGAGGASSCGYPGGAGGSPSHFDFDIMPVPSGSAGSPAPNGSGAQGIGVPAGATPVAGSAYFGQDGAAGMAGSNGAGGTAGTFGASGFVLGNGGNGTAGTPGRGAGGGGGGAGGRSVIFSGVIAQCETFGSAGGGGGGGCGGTLGQGAKGGGASIGLFLYNSSVTANGNALRAGAGGTGGRGGDGGGGGSGGSPGASDRVSDQGEATRGGSGGRGGNGGGGGHGGGGSGGASYALVKSTSSTWTPTGTSLSAGTAGAPGASNGNAGVAGASALQLTF